MPCKHLAAVCYVLAEEFDRDPFGMLAWRGKARDELLAALRLVQAAPGAGGPGPGSPGPGGGGRPGGSGFQPGAARPGRAEPAAGRVPGRVPVARAEPGPAAGAGHRARIHDPGPAPAHVPPAAGARSGARTSPRCWPPRTSGSARTTPATPMAPESPPSELLGLAGSVIGGQNTPHQGFSDPRSRAP